MFTKISLLIAVLIISVQSVAANAPSCLLAAINTQSNPANLQAVCGNATSVENTITNTCGNNVQAAMAAFKSACQNAGVSVSVSASGTISATATGGTQSALSTSTIVYTSHFYNSSCSCTTAALVTGTAYIGPTGLASGTPAVATLAGSAGTGGGNASTAIGAGGSSGTSTATGTSAPASTGAASQLIMDGFSMGALAIAGLAFAL